MSARRTVGLALIAALAMHDLEEGLAYALLHEQTAAMLDVYRITWWRPEPAVFALLLTAFTLSHVLAAWTFGGYAPGVASAVLVNLPISIWALWTLRALPQPE